MYIITTNIKAISIHGKSFILSIKYNVFFFKKQTFFYKNNTSKANKMMFSSCM